MIRRFGEAVNPSQQYRLRRGAYAILPKGPNVLLTTQDGEWQLPGGGIDPGESPLQALHREVLEETGWIISKPHYLGAFRRFCYMPDYDLWAEKLCMIYCATPVHQKCDPTEPDHIGIMTPIEIAADLLAVEGDAYFTKKWRAGDVGAQSRQPINRR